MNTPYACLELAIQHLGSHSSLWVSITGGKIGAESERSAHQCSPVLGTSEKIRALGPSSSTSCSKNRLSYNDSGPRLTPKSFILNQSSKCLFGLPVLQACKLLEGRLWLYSSLDVKIFSSTGQELNNLDSQQRVKGIQTHLGPVSRVY